MKKTLRGSFESGKNNSAVHVVETFAFDVRLVLAQARAPYKWYEKNEAIMEMLLTLDIRGATVTIDATGCQKKVAEKLLEKKANYVLALKVNQGSTFEAVESHFAHEGLTKDFDYHKTVENGHGQFEIRRACMAWAKERCDG